MVRERKEKHACLSDRPPSHTLERRFLSKVTWGSPAWYTTLSVTFFNVLFLKLTQFSLPFCWTRVQESSLFGHLLQHRFADLSRWNLWVCISVLLLSNCINIVYACCLCITSVIVHFATSPQLSTISPFLSLFPSLMFLYLTTFFASSCCNHFNSFSLWSKSF